MALDPRRKAPLASMHHAALTPSINGYANALLTMMLSFPLYGCSRSAAPSFEIVGAYFPAWMFCALFGIVAAAGTRAAFVASGLSSVLPYQLFVCTSIGVIFALLLCLILSG